MRVEPAVRLGLDWNRGFEITIITTTIIIIIIISIIISRFKQFDLFRLQV
jgi:hypothetical protein